MQPASSTSARDARAWHDNVTQGTIGRLCVAMAWIAVACTLLLMGVRVADAISLREPLLVITGGAEAENTFAIWRYVRGESAYSSPYVIPFAGSYYNWLYYAAYGEVIGFWQRMLQLADIWQPTIGRLISLAVVILGTGLTWRLLRDPSRHSSFARRLAGPLSFTLFLGPLIGYWAVALHSEMAAAVCGVGACLIFTRLYETRPMGAIVAASVLSFAAWSFKQSNVYVAGGLGLFLLLRRDFLGLAAAIAIHVIGVGLVTIGGTTAFVRMMSMADQTMAFSMAQFVRNLVNLAVKTTPHLALLVPLGAIALKLARRWPAIIADTHLCLALSGLIAAAALALPASAKIGAAENYYFTMVFFLAYAGVAAIDYLARHGELPRIVAPALTAGFALHAVACLAVVFGFTGVTSVRDWHEHYAARSACLKGRPAPMFHGDPGMNLPWITGSPGPHFVLANIYHEDRGLGRPFERDGIGGLIREGYFKTIALTVGEDPVYDGGDLRLHYVLDTPNCAGLAIYRLKE